MAAPRGQSKNKAHCYTAHSMPPSPTCAQDTHFLIFFLDYTARGAGNASITTPLTQARPSAEPLLSTGKGRAEARPEQRRPHGRGPAAAEARRVPGRFQQRPAAPGSPLPLPGPARSAALHDRGEEAREKKGNGRGRQRSPRRYLPSRCGAGRGRGRAGGSAQRGGERRGRAARPAPVCGSCGRRAPRPRLRRYHSGGG